MAKKKLTKEPVEITGKVNTAGDASTGTYTLPGDFSIAVIETVKKEIDQHLASGDHLTIKGDGIKAIDLTGIQLLYAIRKTANENSKQFTIDITLKEEAEMFLSKAGFDIKKI